MKEPFAMKQHIWGLIPRHPYRRSVEEWIRYRYAGDPYSGRATIEWIEGYGWAASVVCL